MMHVLRVLGFAIAHPFKFLKKLNRRISFSTSTGHIDEVAESFVDLNHPLHLSTFQDVAPKRIIWIVPPISRGGGGATTISRFIKFFESKGIAQEVQVLSMYALDLKSQEICWRDLGISNNVLVRPFNDSKTDEIVIVTAWQTYTKGIRISARNKRILFLQDDESGFEPVSDLGELIKTSIKSFDYAITAGSWLKRTMAAEIKHVTHFEFGVDPIYFSPFVFQHRHLIAFHQPDKPRRMGGLISSFLKEFHEVNPSWKISTVGSNVFDRNLSFVNQRGILDPLHLASVYRSGSIGVILSATNASLVPYEMASTGLHVVTNSGPNSEWLGNLPEINYCNPDLNSLLITVNDLLGKTRKQPNGLPSWDSQLNKFWFGFTRELPAGPIKETFMREL
jgi:O-antigen biosynthesis protein